MADTALAMTRDYPPHWAGIAARGVNALPLPANWQWRLERAVTWWAVGLGLDRLAVDMPGGPPPRTVYITGDKVLEFTFELPLLALQSLPELLALEIESATPFTAALVVGGYYLRPAANPDNVSCQVLLTPRHQYIAAEDADLVILAAGDTQICLAGVNDQKSPWLQARRQRRYRRTLMAVLALAGIFGAPHIYGWRLEQALQQAQPALQNARNQAAAAAASRDRIEALIKARAQAAALGASGPAVIETVAALTQALDKDSHLTSLAVTGQTWQLTGIAPSASDTINAIAALPMSESVTFDNAVSVLDDGREAFSIRFQLHQPAIQDTANAAH